MHKREFQYFQGSCKLPQAHEKVCDKMKQTNKDKNDTCKNVFDGRRAFIGSVWITCAMDINEPQVNDCQCYGDTIC